MKKCPQCGREYDNSMMFCLDDGAELLYGPASLDEPATAIFHSTETPAEAATHAQIHMTEQTAVLLSGIGEAKKTFYKRLIFAPLALVVIILGGFFGYKYFSSTNSKQIESIAVMPFVNESGNADLEYLSDGLTETLIGNLTRLPNLNVKARSSVFRYKGKDTDAKTIGKELNVQAILNGHFAQRGDQLTLSLELVDAQTENAIWAQQYTRKQSEIVSLQSEIAKELSTTLRAKLSGADQAKVTRTATSDPEAYQAYLKGRFYWNQRGQGPGKLEAAIEQFKAAAATDPNYALAYAGLADCYALMPQETGASPSEVLPRAKAFADRALEIDESMAEVHATLGLINESLWQWSDAQKEFERSIELNPTYATAHQWYSLLLGNTGRRDERMAEIKKAYELDPLSAAISLNVGLSYLDRGDHLRAVDQINKTIEISPNFFVAHAGLTAAYLKLGKSNEALLEAQKSVELSKRHAYALRALSHALAASGDRNGALEIIRELEQNSINGKSDKYFIATAYAGIGEKDQAFAWLEKSFQEHNYFLTNAGTDPFAESLRDDPRYKDILRRMGLPE